MNDRRYLTTSEAAELLGVHVRTIYRMIERGDITPIRPGGDGRGRIILVDREEIVEEGHRDD